MEETSPGGTVSCPETGAGFRNIVTQAGWTEQLPAVCQLTRVLGSGSGGSGIKRPHSPHLEHDGKRGLCAGLCGRSSL